MLEYFIFLYKYNFFKRLIDQQEEEKINLFWILKELINNLRNYKKNSNILKELIYKSKNYISISI